MATPLIPVGRFSLRWVVLRPYAVALRYQRYFYQLFASSNLLDLLRRHQTVLYLVLGGAIAVSANSLKIRTAVAEDFGQNNLLFPLIQNQASDIGSEDELVPVTNTSNQPLRVDEDSALIAPDIPTTESGIAGRDRIEYYQVESGDTLSTIANRFNLNLTTILWENKLTARSVLRLGQKLTILPTDGVTYLVKKGDTIEKIARTFRVPADGIASFNQLGTIKPGQRIMVPGGQPIYVAPPAPKPSATPAPAFGTPKPNSPSATPSSSRLLWPTVHRRITQYFNIRHTGADIADAIGTPIYAAEDGVVTTAGWNKGGYGYYIVINHGAGMQTLYAHNSKLYVKAGDHVTRGQQIAEMGSTGRSTGPHLHFEVRINGRRTNPLIYIR